MKLKFTKKRKKVLILFTFFYFLFSIAFFFYLKQIKKNFTTEKLNHVLSTVSPIRDKTDDLCKYRIIGDPENVGKNYIKINFWCSQGRESRNTLALEAIDDKSVKGVLTEFARIIGFDYKIIEEQKFICILNDQLIKDYSLTVPDASTIDCFENENLLKSLKTNF